MPQSFGVDFTSRHEITSTATIHVQHINVFLWHTEQGQPTATNKGSTQGLSARTGYVTILHRIE